MSDKFGMPMVDVRTNKQLIAEIKQLTAERDRLRAALEMMRGFYPEFCDEALKGQP